MTSVGNSNSHPLLSLPFEILSVITECVATGETPQDAAANAIRWGRVCHQSDGLTRESKVARVITHARHLDKALIVIWNLGTGLPQLTTARAIRGWITDPVNRPFLSRIQKIEPDGCKLKVIPPEIIHLSGLNALSLWNNQIAQIAPQTFEGCSALRDLHVDFNRITQIAERTFAGCSAVTWITLEGNQITQISDRTFVECSALGILSLSRNQIAQITERAFAGCSALTDLDLASNQIAQIPEQIFVDCPRLQIVRFGGNQITQIPKQALARCPALQTLRLERNQITQIAERAFASCSALVCLNLGGNEIAHIGPESLAGCQVLWMLDLSDNRITHIDSSTFASCPALRGLILKGNLITQLAPRSFAGCPALQTVSLNNNRIVQIDARAFAGCGALRSLGLEDNPITYIDPQILADLGGWQTRISIGHDLLRVGLQNFLEEFNAFSRYVCRSQLAMFYQAVSAGKLPIADIVEHMKHLKDRNLIYERVYLEDEAVSRVGEVEFIGREDPQWGEHHVCDDMHLFYRALKGAILTKFNRLSAEQRDAVYGRIYAIAREDAGLAADAPAWEDPNWGENHRDDNILRVIDAMADF